MLQIFGDSVPQKKVQRTELFVEISRHIKSEVQRTDILFFLLYLITKTCYDVDSAFSFSAYPELRCYFVENSHAIP